MSEPLRVPEHMSASELVEECRRIIIELRDDIRPLVDDIRRRRESGELVTRRDLKVYNRALSLARYAGDCAHRAVHSKSEASPKRKRRQLLWFMREDEPEDSRKASPR